jgi:tRNA threonylcarbamoyladenosine biosynthesis protein TsaB
VYVLAISASTDQTSIALSKGASVLRVKAWSRSPGKSDELILNIKRLLERAKIIPAQLNMVAVDKGPGSFTGCRNGVNVARTMSYTLDIPIFAAYSLDILAEGARAKLPTRKRAKFLTLLNAHKSLTYGRLYEIEKRKLHSRSVVKAWTVNELVSELEAGTKIYGDIDKEIKKTLKEAGAVVSARNRLNFPQASVLAEMAARSQVSSAEEALLSTWAEVEPAYIRSPDAVEKLESIRSNV